MCSPNMPTVTLSHRRAHNGNKLAQRITIINNQHTNRQRVKFDDEKQDGADHHCDNTVVEMPQQKVSQNNGTGRNTDKNKSIKKPYTPTRISPNHEAVLSTTSNKLEIMELLLRRRQRPVQTRRRSVQGR